MASSQPLFQVPVDSESLYITTIPLLDERFHWAFVHIDERGKCTEHEWAPSTKDPNGPEAYRYRHLSQGAMNRSGSIPILAYFKVPDYTPKSSLDFTAICAAMFPKSCGTVHQNRANQISCRTWVLNILGHLLSPERAQVVEQAVAQKSGTLNHEFATAFLYQKPYTTLVVNI
ncbi:hypothetical protein Moror_625 [Moniliophthora roreri MCA 2997]|uniref:Uncharacterized protein n=2 Tax=Moniliophthora roreri TaxID=221103 RepID=V2WD14_MONRO|nr:hypothetical protein Moror_625 [Moniliophthora roreri MCA 2997]